MNLQTWESIFSIGGNLVVAASLYITLNEIVKSEKDKQREVANKVFIWWDKKKGKKKKRRKKLNFSKFQIIPQNQFMMSLYLLRGNMVILILRHKIRLE